jgi:hypothetical protein
MIKLQELAGMAKEISSKKWFLNADEEVTAIDNDALPDDTEEAFIGCAANIQLAKYMAAANPETILAIAEAYSALEQRLKAAETEVQRLNATEQPVSDGWVKCSERMPIDIDEVRAYKSIEVLATDGHFVTAIDCIAGIPNGKREEFWCTFSTYGNMKPKEITHWMPLPAAPGGQDD